MTLAIALLGITAVGLMLFLAGWLLSVGDQKGKLAMAYNDGKAMLRTVDLARLANLRRMLEEDEHGLAAADACLLYDVCEALRLTEGETQHVVGPAYWLVLDAPVDDAVSPTAVPQLAQVLRVCVGCGKLTPVEELDAVSGGDYCEACWYAGYERDDDGYEGVDWP